MRTLMLCMGLGAIIAGVALATGAEARQSTPMPMKPPPLTVSGTAVTTRVPSYSPRPAQLVPAQGNQNAGQPGDND